MQALGGEHVAAKLGEDRGEGGGARADPVGERRDFDLDPFAGESGALAVQRQMVAELADQDHGEQARTGEAARDRMRRRRRLGDAIAVPAGELLAHPLDDLVSAAARIRASWTPPRRACMSRAPPHLPQTHGGGLDDAFDRQIVGKLARSALRTPPRRPGGPGRRGLGLGLFLGLRFFEGPRSPVRAARRGACPVPTTGRNAHGAPWRAEASAARSPAPGPWLPSRLGSAPPLSRPASRAGRGSSRARSPDRPEACPAGRRQNVRKGSPRRRREQIRRRKSPAKRPPESIRRTHPAAVGRQVFCGICQSMPDNR